ncbi:MAG: 50S ribosomal protein L25 [Candidatus Omnitrophota bacterium]|nr:50S ribosomal protein L25 [Candidatus Omnitrophota bacterium]
MEKVILKVDERKETGKKVAKDLRNKGLIPANVYKGGKDALNLQLSGDEILDALHTKAGANVIITLEISGEGKIKNKTVIIKEIQRDPIKARILHVDFNEISLTETLKVNVPLAPHGEPEGVKKDGGILEHVMWELQIECLPTAIPARIEVDVTNLKIGEPIFVKNIVVPEGVKVLNDPELIAMIVKPPKVEAPKEEVAAAETQEPELIRKKKEEVPEEGEEKKEASKEQAKPAKEASKEGK